MKRLLTLCAALALAACSALEPMRAAPEIAATEKAGAGGRMPSGRDIGVRSAVVAPSAAAATAHPLATQTALDVMKKGGSAMDAAIAANAMLGLVEPTGNGIGGDLFAIVWDPKTRRLYGYNGSGRSPKGASLADIQAVAKKYGDGTTIPPHGTTPVTVPGAVDGWFALHQRFGRAAMSENLRPAIEYARNGAPIPEVIAYYWSRGPSRFEASHASGMLEEYANAKKTYFDPAPVEGTLFRNPDLANTLTSIALGGRDAFYKGSVARTMDGYFKRIGGKLRYEDFASHTGEWVEPFCVEYRGEVKVCEIGPSNQGIAALQMLQMLEPYDLAAMGFGSADALHVQVEAKRLAFADRARGYADPRFAALDPKMFIDPAYAARRSAQIKMDRVLTNEAQGSAALAAAEAKLKDGDTTYLTVADKDGMMVSLIQSNYRGMGSGLVADGLGFMFQDRGELFSLDPAHPNVFAPGKRPFHTIIPAFAFKKDLPSCQVRATAIALACPYEPWMSFGLMGGGMQPQGHVQIILNLIDFDMGLQEAGDAARWEHIGGCEPTDAMGHGGCDTDLGVIEIEGGIPASAKRELERRGHTVKYIGANAGGYQAIARDFDSGAWIAATEMRKDGAADGY